jgi:hypothetical protein
MNSEEFVQAFNEGKTLILNDTTSIYSSGGFAYFSIYAVVSAVIDKVEIDRETPSMISVSNLRGYMMSIIPSQWRVEQ